MPNTIAMAATAAPRTGETPSRIATATPGTMPWLSASPRNAMRRRTTQVPTTPQTRPASSPPISARRMNSNWRGSRKKLGMTSILMNASVAGMNRLHLSLLVLLALVAGACASADESASSTVTEAAAAMTEEATEAEPVTTETAESEPTTTTESTEDEDHEDERPRPRRRRPRPRRRRTRRRRVRRVDPRRHRRRRGGRDAQPRLVVADTENGVTVLDLVTEEVLTEVATTGPARLTVTDDGRYVVASQYDDDEVVFLDGGAWGVDHGDHVHFYTAEPGQVGDAIEVDQPAHVVVTDASIALFSDGEGRAMLLSQDALEEGNTDLAELEIGSVETGIPHHGVVADFDDVRIATIPFEGIDGDIPNEIGVEGEDGIEPLADCPEMHGEHVTSDGMVIACDDRIVVIDVDSDGAEATTVEYPDGLSADRVWSWAGAHESDLVAAVEEDALLIVDTETQETTALDLPADGVTMTAGADDTAVLLTADGGVHLIDLENAEIVATQPVGPVYDAEDDDAIRPDIAVGTDRAYISDPAAGTILEIATNDDLRVARTLTVDGVPGFLAHVGDELR